jgi:hypothetical protein
MMKKLITICLAVLVVAVQAYGVVVVNFDDLADGYVLTGSNYAGLTWELGNNGYNNNQGSWGIPSYSTHYPYSEPQNAINLWGCTLLGIGFPTQVDVSGAYFAGQGSEANWTNKVRVHGYRNGSEIATTDWFTDIDSHPDWFAMNLTQVDRIVIESNPVWNGGGWYGMDNLTYDVPEPATICLFAIAGLFIRGKK